MEFIYPNSQEAPLRSLARWIFSHQNNRGQFVVK